MDDEAIADDEALSPVSSSCAFLSFLASSSPSGLGGSTFCLRDDGAVAFASPPPSSACSSVSFPCPCAPRFLLDETNAEEEEGDLTLPASSSTTSLLSALSVVRAPSERGKQTNGTKSGEEQKDGHVCLRIVIIFIPLTIINNILAVSIDCSVRAIRKRQKQTNQIRRRAERKRVLLSHPLNPLLTCSRHCLLCSVHRLQKENKEMEPNQEKRRRKESFSLFESSVISSKIALFTFWNSQGNKTEQNQRREGRQRVFISRSY